MSNPDLVLEKSKKTLYVGIIAIALIVSMVGGASFYSYVQIEHKMEQRAHTLKVH